MTHHDFENALAALKALTHNDDETPMMIDVACWLIDHLDEVTAALQAAIEQPVTAPVPVFYSENANGLDGLEKVAMAVLSNLMIKTNATEAEFMIGNEKDGEFVFTCKRMPGQTAPVQNETGRDLLDLMRETVIYSDHVEMPIRTYEAMKAALQQPAQGVDYIRKDIVPQDRAKEALEAVEYCIKIISNHRIPKQENAIWSSGSSANPRITQETLETILALFVAHGGNE